MERITISFIKNKATESVLPQLAGKRHFPRSVENRAAWNGPVEDKQLIAFSYRREFIADCVESPCRRRPV
ncbi:hypothetical protein EDC52_10257 [Biostraticola tofi]|uniref:Uncharacterized protein n=1 Tax=Biostraticola tofi TaxID=466109 RepID=A0A4R3Z4A5_9GAMM|nr:hypothetical protein EDC52_10257 [Biostraticola tofi]